MKKRVFLHLPILILCLVSGLARGNEGFFQARQIDNRWWLISPSGQPFISKGVTTILFAQDYIQGTNISPYGQAAKAKYGSQDAWRAAVAQRLAEWGFNTVGAWSDEKLTNALKDHRRFAYTPILNLGCDFVDEKQQEQAWLKGIFPDVFDPDFEKYVRKRAVELCSPHSGDHWLMGWFIDNELRWGPDWRGPDELLTMFLSSPAGSPGKKAAIDLMRERYGGIADFNHVWNTSFQSWAELEKASPVKQPFGRKAIYAQNQEVERKSELDDPKFAAFSADCSAFLSRLAERYFHITSDALKNADPNHMNFGCRFAYFPPGPVIEAAARYVDVISFNCYSTDPSPAIRKYSGFGKPLIIGEFSFRGEDSGLPNTKGAGPKVKTQALRAAGFENYVTAAIGNPALVGYHWFEHADEPKEGRFDGENSNYGLVDIHDEPYKELTSVMVRVNANAEKLHQK